MSRINSLNHSLIYSVFYVYPIKGTPIGVHIMWNYIILST